MKKAILGLAALLTGCAAQAQGVENAVTASQRDTPALWWREVPAYGASTVMSRNVCGNSEPIITMDEHGYSLECGNDSIEGKYVFVHYQHPEILNADGKVVLEAACENTLFERSVLDMYYAPDMVTTVRWLDNGYDGNPDSYGAWVKFGREPAEPVDEFNVSEEQMAQAYRNLLERLNVKQIQQSWEALYSLL